MVVVDTAPRPGRSTASFPSGLWIVFGCFTLRFDDVTSLKVLDLDGSSIIHGREVAQSPENKKLRVNTEIYLMYTADA